MIAELLILLVRLYQWTLRPFIGPHCRFEPSCSHYAIEALRRHGPVHGARLAATRILRCNPWHAGGHDPVPLSGVRETARILPLPRGEGRGEGSASSATVTARVRPPTCTCRHAMPGATPLMDQT